MNIDPQFNPSRGEGPLTRRIARRKSAAEDAPSRAFNLKMLSDLRKVWWGSDPQVR